MTCDGTVVTVGESGYRLQLVNDADETRGPLLVANPDKWQGTEPFSYASEALQTNLCYWRSDARLHRPGTGLPWMLPLGGSRLVLGFTAKFNVARNDGHPYKPWVERVVSVDCTKARFPYR
jgi:hypothetical protein